MQAIDDWWRPWAGYAYRHLPARAAEPLDVRYAGQGSDNRWNVPGEPTLYLASDRGVVFAEFGRHFSDDVVLTPDIRVRRKKRAIYRLEVALERVLDLCDVRACETLLGLREPRWYEDIATARSVARRIRLNQAMRVRSVPFPEPTHQDRWVLVVFLENTPGFPTRYVQSVQRVDIF